MIGQTITSMRIESMADAPTRAQKPTYSSSPCSMSQLPGHEHAVRIFHVIAERPAVPEAVALVQPSRRQERVHGAGFQAEATIRPPVRLVEDVRQHLRGDALAQVRGHRAHGLDLAVNRVELLERA